MEIKSLSSKVKSVYIAIPIDYFNLTSNTWIRQRENGISELNKPGLLYFIVVRHRLFFKPMDFSISIK